MRKEEILMPEHPLGKKIRQIPQIITSDKSEIIPDGALSLKELFKPEEMEKRGVDGLVLKKIALQAVRLLARISQAGVLPGLIDQESLMVDLGRTSYPLYLREPEHFQLLDLEQDYEWYPEDERIFGDTVLFDGEKQLLADNRLVLKILIGAHKGNLKLPVRRDDQEHCWIYYQTLPEEFRRRLEQNEAYGYEELEDLIADSIVREEEFALHESEGLLEGEIPLQAAMVDENRVLDVLYMIIRTDTQSPFSISRTMYLLMDEVEEECRRTGRRLRQAFVYGDSHVRVREFAQYPEGFRCQFDSAGSDCGPSQVMIIAAELWAQELKSAKETKKEMDYRSYLVLDGRIPNDQMFSLALERLEEIRQTGVSFAIRSSGEIGCEAVRRLESLVDEREQKGGKEE